MKLLASLLIASALSACSAAPPEMMQRSAANEARLTGLTAGKVAGAPISCLSSFRAKNMIVIDDNTVAFRDGGRVYVNHMQGGCLNLGRGGSALVTDTTVSSLCRGDIARVVDTANSISMGSCVFGDFVPYARTPG